MLAAVLANRLDGIVREMTNALLRSARSALINTGRDFSCAITTADDQLLAVAEGLPVHTFGAHLQTASMTALHADLAPGDAFLHDDPYQRAQVLRLRERALPAEREKDVQAGLSARLDEAG